MKINIRKEVREWTDAGLGINLFLEPQKYEWETFYERFCSARLGYFLHVLGCRIGWHTSMIFDPLHSGTFPSALRSWLWNLWHVDIYWPICHRIDEWRRPEYYAEQRRFLDASMQALEEGCADKMDAPPPFSNENFHGAILGKRYFERVVEILKKK